MSGLLDQLGNLDDLAARFGLPADQVRSIADQLSGALSGGGDKMAAFAETAGRFGLPVEQLEGMFGGVLAGGEAGLGGVIAALDKDGDRNPLDDLAGMAKGLLGGS